MQKHLYYNSVVNQGASEKIWWIRSFVMFAITIYIDDRIMFLQFWGQSYIVAWPVQRRFAYGAKFQKLLNERGEIKSNLGYSNSFPRKQKQQCRNRVH